MKLSSSLKSILLLYIALDCVAYRFLQILPRKIFFVDVRRSYFINQQSAKFFGLQKGYIHSISATIDESSRSPDSPEYSRKLRALWNDAVQFIENMEQAEFRRAFFEKLKFIFISTKTNLSNGEVGKRGEELVLLQFFIMTFVFFGVPFFISFFIKLSGLLSTFLGIYLMFRGVWDLKDNVTPFIYPIEGNRLITTGVYDVVRHPIYTGLLFFSAGVAIASDSIEKAVLTAILAYLLERKADKEEQLLTVLHPIDYPAYMKQTKKLLPSFN